MKDNEKSLTMLDRLALAFVVGLTTFIPFTLIWIFIVAKGSLIELPFYPVWIFTGIGAVLGFLNLQEQAIKLVTKPFIHILGFNR